jgi:hypothetical protein
MSNVEVDTVELLNRLLVRSRMSTFKRGFFQKPSHENSTKAQTLFTY